MLAATTYTAVTTVALGSWFSADPAGFMLIAIVIIVTIALASLWLPKW
jgi:hypothetical protein